MSGQNDQVLLATAGYDHSIRFWQAHSGMCSRTINHPDGSINKLEITPDKQHIAAASYQHVKLYEIHTGHPNPVLDYEVPAPKNFTAIGFHADCKWMYTGSEDGTVRIWDFRSRATQCSRIFQVNSPVNCVCLHPNQAEMFIGDQSGALHTWDLRTDLNESMIPDLEASILSISIDPMGTLMAAVNNKGRCYIWTLTGGRRPGEQTVFRPKTRFPAHTRHILKCLFSPDSTLLATTSADQTCRIWRTADLSQMTVLKCEKQRWVWDCAFSGDSQYIITASSDNVARLWSVTGGDVKKEYIGHQRSIVCLAFRDENV